MVAQSPTAKTCSSSVERSVSSTATKPRSSSGSPVVANHPAALASVTTNAASASSRLPSSSLHRAALDAPARLALQQPHAAALEDRPHLAARRVGLSGQDLALGDQRDLQLGARGRGPQVMVDRQRQFHAARAAADHDDVERAGPGSHALQESEPAPAEVGDGLHRHRTFRRAGDRLEAGRRADIERQQVVGDRRPVLQQHLAVGAIDAGRLGMDQAGAGPGAQPCQVDVAFVECVLPGDEARDHAGVRRLDVPRDQAEPHPGHRLHGEAFQDMDVGMAAANQHEVLEERRGLQWDPYIRSVGPLVWPQKISYIQRIILIS